MPSPGKWIFVTAGFAIGISTLAVAVSPGLRSYLTSGIQVRELIRFRERFTPENVGKSCPNYPLHRLAACARAMIIDENRLHFASMTGRIYYLATIASVASYADEFARTRAEKVEARTDLLEYLNEEMKVVLIQTGGKVDLGMLDGTQAEENPYESAEAALARRYHANLVDLWIKNWRKDEKYLAANPGVNADGDLAPRLTVLRADRDELFSRFSIDLSRYGKHRQPASAPEAAFAPTEPEEPAAAPSSSPSPGA